MSTDYSEIFCTAVDEIVSKKLEGLQYDVTKICTIIDNSEKSSGKYQVSTGVVKFDAYATSGEYSIGESVLVTIPNGNYDFQKVIIGRSVADTSVPTNYSSPLNMMTRIDDYIIPVEGEVSLLANDVPEEVNDVGTICPLGINIADKDLSGFTKLGISADFQAWLLDMDTTSGEYGLKITIESEDMVVQGESGLKYNSFYFSSADMIGNPYAFESYYTQEKVIDISHIKNIKNITVDFYQRGNFKDSTGVLIPYKEAYYNTILERNLSELEYEGLVAAANTSSIALMNMLGLNEFEVLQLMEPFGLSNINSFANLFLDGFEVGAKLVDNLFVNNVKLYFGYNLNEFIEEEVLRLYTADGLTYHYTKNNDKNIYIRWAHKISDNHYDILNQSDIGFSECEIRWFKENIGYTPPEGEELDPYAGQNWEPIVEEENAKKDLHCLFTPRATGEGVHSTGTQTEKVKAIAIVTTKVFNGVFTEENIQTYESNVLIFENEEKMPDDKTFVGSSTFKIVCRDGSEGNYFIYNPNGKINNEGVGRGFARYFDITYQDIPLERLGELNIKVDWIKWYLPKFKSMILTSTAFIEDNSGELGAFPKEFDGISYDEITRIKIKDEYGNTVYPKSTQGFSIKNQWNHGDCNNTIRCSASINGVIYDAVKELRFGKTGTNGTNQTFLIECLNNQNALIINKPGLSFQNTLTLAARLYDSNGLEIDLTEDQKEKIVWSWYKKTNVTNDYILLPEKKTGQTITLTCNTDELNMDNYYIIQATYANSGAVQRQLVTYFPVPLKTSTTTDMEGAREIIYNSQGQPSYYNDAYIVYYKDSSGTTVPASAREMMWIINYDEDQTVYRNDVPSSNSQLISDYLPKLKLLTVKGNGGYYGLSASPMYASGYSDKICVSVQNKERGFGWSQPILIVKSAYDYPMLNDWDGTLKMDDTKGTILSTMLGAGKKNPDNTFSGVLIGDVTQAGGSDTQLGVYGLHEGEISYSLKEDGTATFGKTGKGQIHINGNEGTIQSGLYASHKQGMCIDMDDGFIDIKSNRTIYMPVLSTAELTEEDFQNNVYYVNRDGVFYECNYDSYMSTSPRPTLYIYDVSKAGVYISPGIDNNYLSIKGNSGGDIIKVTTDEYCLQSENWITSSQAEGSKLSLNDGRLDMKSSYGNVILSSDGQNKDNPFFAITQTGASAKVKELFHCSNDGYYLQSLDYRDSDLVERKGFYSNEPDTLFNLMVMVKTTTEIIDEIPKINESWYIGFYDKDHNQFVPIKAGWKDISDNTISNKTAQMQDVCLGWDNKETNDYGHRGPEKYDRSIETEYDPTKTYYIRVRVDSKDIYDNEVIFKKVLSKEEFDGYDLFKDYHINYCLDENNIISDLSGEVKVYESYTVRLENNLASVTYDNLNQFHEAAIEGKLWSEDPESTIVKGYRLEITYVNNNTIKKYPSEYLPDQSYIEYGGELYATNFTDVELSSGDSISTIKVVMCQGTYKNALFNSTFMIQKFNLDNIMNSTFKLKLSSDNQNQAEYLINNKTQWIQTGTQPKYSIKENLYYSQNALSQAEEITQYGSGFKFDLGQNQIVCYDLKLEGYNNTNYKAILDFAAPHYPLTIGDKFKVDWAGNIIISASKRGQKYNATKYLLDHMSSSYSYTET